MAKVDYEVKMRIDALTDEQLDRKVDHLRHTLPNLHTELDYATRVQRDRRHAAAKKTLDEARRNPR